MENPENGIKRRTPSKMEYQYKYRYIHESGSNHTENNENTRSCQPACLLYTSDAADE